MAIPRPVTAMSVWDEYVLTTAPMAEIFQFSYDSWMRIANQPATSEEEIEDLIEAWNIAMEFQDVFAHLPDEYWGRVHPNSPENYRNEDFILMTSDAMEAIGRNIRASRRARTISRYGAAAA